MIRPEIDTALKDLEPMVHSFARKWARNNYDLYPDLVQQGFMGIVEAHKRYREDSNCKFSSWAFFYIRKYVREYTLKQWNYINKTVSEDKVPEQPYNGGIDTDTIDVNRAMVGLTEKQRTIFIMKNEGYTLSEISKHLAESKIVERTYSLESIRLQYIKN